MSFMDAREHGSKVGSGGVASQQQANVDRRERLRRLALETIDLAKKDEEGADAEASDVEGNEGAHAGERAHPTIDELKEEVIEEEVEEVTVMGRVSEGLRSASENPGLRNLGGLGFFFLASTFAYSCYKVFRKATSGRARRKRTVNKNVEVVERLKHLSLIHI